MPRPPLLPTLDWNAIFESGQSFDEWIQVGDHPDHRDKMKSMAADQPLSDADRAALAGLAKQVHVIAIAEDWCGDVVRNVPVLEAIRRAAPDKVLVRYIPRDHESGAFVRFLTNGGEAIPKLVFLSDQFVETGNFGPMPMAEREVIAQGKACGKGGKAREIVSAMYKEDEANGKRRVVDELLFRIKIAASSEPKQHGGG